MRIKQVSPLLVGLVAVCAAGSAAAYTPSGRTSAAGNYSGYALDASSDASSFKVSNSGVKVKVAADDGEGLGYSAWAQATGGSLKAAVDTDFPGPSGWFYSDASVATATATATFIDYVTFGGGSGLASASLAGLLKGKLGGDQTASSATASFSVSLALLDEYRGQGDSWYTTATPLSETESVSGKKSKKIQTEYESSFDFIYGQTYRLTATLALSANNGGYADFGNTASFGFKAAPNVYLTSASGLSYGLPTAPVPEPETYAMLLAGLAMVGVMARRRFN